MFLKVKVVHDLCIACGICEGDLPEVFHLSDEGFAELVMEPVEADYHDRLKQVMEDCPTGAISIDEANAPASTPQEVEDESEATTESRCKSCETVDEETTNTKPERNVNMKIKVVEDLCIGCGICEGIAPEVFSLETEPYAVVLLDPIPEEFHAAVREAAEACPDSAIEIEE